MKLRRDPPSDFQPLPRRRRLLILALAVATAMAVIWLMLQPQLRKMEAAAKRKAAGPATPADCAASQSDGCVGGTMGVIAPPR